MEQEQSVSSYEDLAELEKEFEDTETEILRKQTLLQAPLYAKRAQLVATIPTFWPLVLEQCPPDIDQFIQPSDSAVLFSSLKTIDVQRFEVPPYSDGEGDAGNPRSVLIRFEFNENEWFDDTVLEKRFWWRRATDGRTGLVSEPVKIRWKKGKDLTQGLTDLAVAAFEAEKRAEVETNGAGKDAKGKGKGKPKRLPEVEAVAKKMETCTEGSLSFFAFFGFRGHHISAAESELATKEEQERRAQGKKEGGGEGKKPEGDGPEVEEEDDDDVDEYDTEIFPTGEDLSIALSEDLFPGALKYFTQAQEDDGISDADFEEDEEEGQEEGDEMVDLRELVRGKGSKEEDDEGDAERARKRRKA
ncbi:MAG: hypothetical protein M1817_000764 [Caeruleum heppii]|nr:MAG: hypothetical protein M1817_000764 [Caeruleum heppii]